MSPSDQMEIFDRQIIPPELAVRAMRDSGYKNTAFALAELIDNSIQAGADHIDVICIEEYVVVSQRQRRRLKAIGVLDNGSGMAPDVLGLALQFGNGTHLADRRGIGRFGMGLPNSSISQCRRVEVWSWQNGPDNAMYSYLDVDEIEQSGLSSVPIPIARALPSDWRSRSEAIGTTGTLVLWTKFDEYRLTWRGARATLVNTETLVGRMYRKFIADGLVSIRLLALESDDSKTMDNSVRVNDPLYLAKESSTPPPFDKEPMFQKWGDEDEIFSIDYHGKIHQVTVRMSWARPQTVPSDGVDRGNKPYGKHAAKNLGLSIVRAGRELDLDSGWTNSYNPVERWWGVEVEFPPILDEVFGVTNNKQSATIFSELAQFDWNAEKNRRESFNDYLGRIQGEGDPRALLLPIVEHIRRQLVEVRRALKNQTVGTRSRKNRHDDGPAPEDLATSKFRQREKEGHPTDADKEEFKKEDRDALEKDLTDDKDYPQDVAADIADAILRRKRKVSFFTKDMDGYAFFNVEHHQGGLTAIVFNRKHPFYGQLMETLRPETGDETDEELIHRINRAADTLELLFSAWARYEMEDPAQKDRLFDMRQEWGKMARFFLSQENE